MSPSKGGIEFMSHIPFQGGGEIELNEPDSDKPIVMVDHMTNTYTRFFAVCILSLNLISLFSLWTIVIRNYQNLDESIQQSTKLHQSCAHLELLYCQVTK